MSNAWSNLFEARDTNGDGTNDSWSYRGPYASRQGEVVAFRAAVTGTPATGHKWRFAELPKGARMITLTSLHTDLGTGGAGSVPGDLGYETTDPDAFSASDIDFNTVDATGTERCTPAISVNAVATSATDYLTVTFGTVSGGTSGTITLIGAYAITDGVGG